MSPRLKRKGISVNAFAKSVGVTASAVTQRIQKGKMAEAVFDDGSLDEEMARVLWYANANPSFMRSRPKDDAATPKKPGSQTAKHNEEARGEYKIKTEQAEVNLEMSRLKLAVEKGLYVSIDEVSRAHKAAGRATRDMFLNFASRHGAEMAGELGVDPGTFIGLLESHIRKALNETADAPMTDGGDGEE